MDVLIHLHRTVKCYPDRLAVVDGATKLTWAQFDERSRRLAAALAGLGVQKGDRVGVLMYNGFRFMEAFYAIPRMGAIIVPLNTRYSPPELAFALNDCEAVAVLVDEDFVPLLDKAQPDLKSVRQYIFNGQGPIPDQMLEYDLLLENSADWKDFEDVQPDEDDVLGLFYTGGTTGRSKGVMLTHKNMASNALHSVIHLEASLDSVYLHLAPMFHSADAQGVFNFTMMGARHTFLPRFDPVQFLEMVQRERVTHSGMVATLVNLLIQVPTIQEYDLSSLQVIYYGGSTLPGEVLKRASLLMPCHFMQAYGLTESSPCLTFMDREGLAEAMQAAPTDPAAKRLRSCGQPIVNVEIRVVDEEGKTLPPGELGEVIARGPNIMKGYWNLPKETARTLRNGWLYTGDIGTFDELDYLYIIDRKKDMIKSGGENVFAAEVENAIYTHPAVLENVVFGVPDEKWGERVHAAIVLKPGQHATPEEIVAKCRELIAGFKVPRSIEFVDEIPKSGAGKILKRLMRDKYWQNQPQ